MVDRYIQQKHGSDDIDTQNLFLLANALGTGTTSMALALSTPTPRPVRIIVKSQIGITEPVHVQSSWFPLVDRNPQKFVDIYSANESNFQKATQRVYRSSDMASRLKVLVLP